MRATPARAHRLDGAFGALADPTRRRVIELLGRAPHRAGELAVATHASRPGMSRHLRILREAGLVREAGDALDARARVYELEREAFSGVKGWLDEVEAFWADQLTSFRALAEARASASSPGRRRKVRPRTRRE